MADAATDSERSSVTLLRLVTELADPQHALPAARTIVAWTNGFITMGPAGAFRLGSDLEDAWAVCLGLDRVLNAVQRGGRG